MNAARLVAELLDDAVVFPDLGYSASAQTSFLNHATETLFKGVPAFFAAHLRVSKSQMHGWIHGEVQMSLPRLVLTAYCCNCAVADIMLGNNVMLSLHAAPSSEKRNIVTQTRAGAKRPHEQLREELDALVENQPSMKTPRRLQPPSTYR
ncbi:hypothetical protein [Paraburkholderia hospita]|uniref:hypothetical protein n=1 Tax=Paraburkholderia hospita TaxID=169430 RepID=UPI001178A15C|nr:hypothetical protein [Paraburkholderia hospita]